MTAIEFLAKYGKKINSYTNLHISTCSKKYMSDIWECVSATTLLDIIQAMNLDNYRVFLWDIIFIVIKSIDHTKLSVHLSDLLLYYHKEIPSEIFYFRNQLLANQFKKTGTDGYIRMYLINMGGSIYDMTKNAINLSNRLCHLDPIIFFKEIEPFGKPTVE